jgi:hypothetical protein
VSSKLTEQNQLDGEIVGKWSQYMIIIFQNY